MNYQLPAPDEYAPYYAAYVAFSGDSDILDLLRTQLTDSREQLESISESASLLAYEPGKWTPKELLLHVVDTERVFSYRALSFARGETKSLPGFDQDLFVAHSHANDRSWKSLIEEFVLVRQATIAFWDSLAESDWPIAGRANDLPISVRALARITYGHAEHHFRILAERYSHRTMVGKQSAAAAVE